nr:MAG TPA: hypothetical protein [Caudoviricetes sp.]
MSSAELIVYSYWFFMVVPICRVAVSRPTSTVLR